MHCKYIRKTEYKQIQERQLVHKLMSKERGYTKYFVLFSDLGTGMT